MKKTNNFKKPIQNKRNKDNNKLSIKKTSKGMIKLYTDCKSLNVGIQTLFEADKDISKLLSDTSKGIKQGSYPTDKEVFYQILMELTYITQDLITTSKLNSLWDIHISGNKVYVRTDKYNSFGWNKHIEKTKTGKEIVTYRMFLTLYGYKTEDSYRNNMVNKELWKVLEEK